MVTVPLKNGKPEFSVFRFEFDYKRCCVAIGGACGHPTPIEWQPR